MNRAAQFCFVSFLSLVQSCDSTSWPTDQASILNILADEQQEFLAIEAQMRADNIHIISEGDLTSPPTNQVASMNQLLIMIQREKYLDLIRHNSPYVFEYWETTFSVAVPVPPTDGPQYFLQLKRDETQTVRNTCDSTIIRQNCGQCAIQIDDKWSVHWSWTPEDPTYTDENCITRCRVN